jgi:hypothetical protein
MKKIKRNKEYFERLFPTQIDDNIKRNKKRTTKTYTENQRKNTRTSEQNKVQPSPSADVQPSPSTTKEIDHRLESNWAIEKFVSHRWKTINKRRNCKPWARWK